MLTLPTHLVWLRHCNCHPLFLSSSFFLLPFCDAHPSLTPCTLSLPITLVPPHPSCVAVWQITSPISTPGSLSTQLVSSTRLGHTYRTIYCDAFWTRKRVPKRHRRCCCSFFLGLLLSDFQRIKAFSFQNRPSVNFAHTLNTIFSTIALLQMFKLSLNLLIKTN